MSPSLATPRHLLANLFDEAVAAADPLQRMRAHLPAPPKGRTVVIGAGKASAAMASALQSLWPLPLSGTVVVPHGHSASSGSVRVLEAGHPEPDASGLAASQALFDTVRGLTADDLVIALISGGGSALLPAPPPDLNLEDEIRVNRALLASGLPISGMNLIRKHVSLIKGGRLALAAFPARVVSFVISDIPGDDLSLVASGPTLASAGDRAATLTAIHTAQLEPVLGAKVMNWLQRPQASAPAPDDPRFSGHEAHLLASANVSLERARAAARERHGLEAVILSDAIEGEARDIGAMHAALARETAVRGRPWTPPVLLLSGGETTVTANAASGAGGRNTEFALAAAIALAGVPGIHGLAADTDGIDGRSAAAGAWFDGDSTSRMRQAGVDPLAALRAHDSATAFAAIGDLLVTGPTHTNVNDFRALLVTA